MDLLPVYQFPCSGRYNDEDMKAMFAQKKVNHELDEKAYNSLYNEILRLNTKDYFNANDIKKIITFDEKNVKKAINQALSINIDLSYNDFEQEMLKILMAKIDFQKQLIKEIEDPYNDKKKVSSVPIQVCAENNNNFAEQATKVKNIIIEDNNKTEQLIKQIKKGDFKTFFISQKQFAKQQIEQHDLMDAYGKDIKRDDNVVANLTNTSGNKQSKFM